ncbi:MAG: 30S ribosomal protein S17e [Candidatus Woesearchaeota archaeon]|nr:MAG: 30S ribosomal protein S17e [Candidatus Woesearchaeota archaeon]
MGRIKTMQIKRVTKKLLELHKGKFTENFDQNKKLVDQFIETKSKKLRNVIAGAVTKDTRVKKD